MRQLWKYWLGGLFLSGLVTFLPVATSLHTGPSGPTTSSPGLVDRPARITFVGTSLTALTGWPEAVAYRLATCGLPRPEITVIAKGGASSAFGLEQIRQIQHSHPDIVIIEFSINDADLRRGTSLTRSRARHEALITALRTPPPDRQGQPAPQIALLITAPAYGIKSWIRPWLAQYQALYPAMAENWGLGVIDARAPWQQAITAHGWKTLLPDGIHPTDAAARALTGGAVSAYLGQVMGNPCPA